MKLLVILLITSIFASCGSWHYSPLDTAIETTLQADSLNNQSRIAAQQYIDSVNNAHVIIHNSKY